MSKLLKLGMTVAVDTETTGLSRYHGDRPFACSFCDEDGNLAYLRWEVDPMTREVHVPQSAVRLLNGFFSSGRQFVFHHSKFDISMFESIGVQVPWGEVDDTLVAFRCLRTGERQYGLKPLAAKFANYPQEDERDLRNATKKARRLGKKEGWKLSEEVPADYWMAPPELCRKYALGDVERTMLLWILARDKLDELDVRDTYELEMAIQPLCVDMERRGVCLDMNLIEAGQAELIDVIADIRRKLEEYAWKGFNPNSHPQKATLLFSKLGLQPRGWTKAGKPSTDKNALPLIDHPAAQLLLDHMNAVKQCQFFAAWEHSAVKEDGLWVIHPTFNPQAADTGRFSCSNPNLQQVPSRDPEAAARARKPFIPRPGHVWIPADYSQMELRMLASRAKEESMLEAFRKGEDIHSATAKMIFGTDEGEARNISKNINFGISYGAGADKIAETAGKSTYEASQFLEKYLSTFSGLRDYMKEIVARGRAEGFIVNPFGRRIDVPRDRVYTALNYDIQSSGADVCKRAMIRTAPIAAAAGGALVLQVHDEIVFEIPRGAVNPGLLRVLKSEMEAAADCKFSIPLGVDVSYCERSWAEKDEVVL